jgi:hypothetical protein
MGTNDLPPQGGQQEARTSGQQLRRFRKAAAGIASSLKPKPLPSYALHYYDAMAAKFGTLPPPAAGNDIAQKAYDDAKAVVDTDRDKVTWEQLLLLDLSLTRGLAFDDLLLRIADLRARLAGNAPPMPDGLAVKLEIAEEKNLPRLRAEAEALVTRVWLARMARDARDGYVAELRKTLLISLIVIVGGFWLFVNSAVSQNAPLYVVIVASGMLGALISIFRRLQASVASAPAIELSSDLSALAHEKRMMVLSMLAGAVFAIILYALLVAGMSDVLGTSVVPQFTDARAGTSGLDFGKFVNEVGPRDGASYAKVIVWSFIAGFFEQFVPDVLDRIAKKKQSG